MSGGMLSFEAAFMPHMLTSDGREGGADPAQALRVMHAARVDRPTDRRAEDNRRDHPAAFACCVHATVGGAAAGPAPVRATATSGGRRIRLRGRS